MTNTPLKQTSDVKQGWVFLALLLLVGGVFVYTVLPQLDSKGRKSRTAELVGMPAPDFFLPVIFGGQPDERIRLSDLKGKVVVLDFWASWCEPCRAMAPIIDRIASRATPLDVVVLGVNTADTQTRAKESASERSDQHTSVFDSGEVARSFGASVLPTVVVIDRSGVVTASESKELSESEIWDMVERANAK